MIRVLLLLAFFSSCLPAQSGLQEDFQRAATLYQRGLYWGAEPYFRKVALARPAFGEAQFGVAMCLLKTKRYEESLSFFEAAEKAENPQAQFFGFHAECLDWLSRTDEAKKKLKRALEIDPDNFHGHFLKGVIAQREGDFETARKALEWCRRNDPKHIATAFQLASLLQRQGKLDEAEKLARVVVKLDPRHARVHYILAGIARRRGDKELARKELRTWRRLTAEYEARTKKQVQVDGYLALAFRFLNERKLERAVAYLARTLEVAPGHPQATSTLKELLLAFEQKGKGSSPLAMKIRSLVH
ncbi:MAG TPA: tetratricopeptide repeat protein [Planctomycetes bacterium]|nr:tetratricopeptide repeat protein [Planctomycetota bacterium]